MARRALFSDGQATDIVYINIRAGGKLNSMAELARANCEALWEDFEPYADPHFLSGIRRDFHARYWEMYLTVYFMRQGFKVVCPKPSGPDVGIESGGRRIWFEATCPNRGAEANPDRVTESEDGVARRVPNEQMVLRYLSSIKEKYEAQYPNWLKSGVVTTDDAFVIALNPKNLDEWADTVPPRILQAALTIGALYATIDPKTMQQVGGGFLYRENLTRASGVEVRTGVFQRPEYTALSALLCSRIDVANQPAHMGDDFQLVPNPHATASLPEGFRLRGTYFRVEPNDEGYTVTGGG